MTNTGQFQNTIDRFIELYGDRKGDIGDSIHAGLAWLDDTRVVLLAGGEGNSHEPASWRRAGRLISLAQHLKRPILLWNLSFQPDEQNLPLVANHALQSSEAQLLQLPLPIIGVFDQAHPSKLAMLDGAVLLERINVHPSVLPTLRIVDSPTGIKATVLELLEHVSTIPAENLTSARIQRLQRIIEQKD